MNTSYIDIQKSYPQILACTPKTSPWGYMYPQTEMCVGMLAEIHSSEYRPCFIPYQFCSKIGNNMGAPGVFNTCRKILELSTKTLGTYTQDAAKKHYLTFNYNHFIHFGNEQFHFDILKLRPCI